MIDLAGLDALSAVGWALLVLGSLTATAVGVTRLVRMLYAWRSPASLGASGFGPLAASTSTSFSLLVPARRGDDRLGATLDHLAALDHDRFEVVAVVGYDDLPNRAAAVAAAARHPQRVQSFVDRRRRRSRGARLNAALDECHAQVVGLFEVGDEVHPRLLRHVDACLGASPEVGAVQGGVRQVAATTARWFTPSSVVDQYFWSRSRLHFHARQRFTPLDRSSVFVRVPVLLEAGGWDGRCVAEGSELGVRLSVRGTPIVVAYDPELATRSPAPATLRAVTGAQTQRIRGFLQVLRKGVWRELPTRRQRLLARSTLVRPLVEALTSLGVVVGFGAALVMGAPSLALGLVGLPILPALVGLAAQWAGLSELGRLEGRPVRRRDRLRLVASFVPYELLTSLAAVAALLGRGGDDPGVPVAPNKQPHVLDLGLEPSEPSEPSDHDASDPWVDRVADTASDRHELPA